MRPPSTTPTPSTAGLRASVVIPTYDRHEGIARLLADLAGQTVPGASFEVIVVDDGSAVEVGRGLRPVDFEFRLRLFRQPNAGAAAARQRGAQAASGELLVFVDDDLELSPRFLEAHLRNHAAHERAVVIGRLRAGEGSRRRPLAERYRLGIGDRLSDKVSAGRRRVAGRDVYTGNLSLRRALFVEVGGFDLGLRQLEDVELGLRLQKAGARFVLSDEASASQTRDPMPNDRWFARSVADGSHHVRVSRKHPDMPEANPWHFMEFVNPVSRPLLTLSALAPSPAAALAQSALATASAADALGFERVAIAGATFVYGVNLFRGVGLEAGGPRAVMRELREFRRGMEQLGTRRRGGGVGLRGLLEAIEEDHRMLVRNADHYDPRRRTISSPASTFVTNSGFQLVVSYRVMRHLRSLELPLATRALARGMRHAFGSDVHWDADLEPGLVVIHGFGLAISFAARAAHGCVLSQNVTLGIGRDGETGEIGAPSLGEDVIVGPSSTLTGPIAIGAGTKIGAGCTVHTSVPPRTIVEAPAPAMRPRRPI